MQSWATIFLVYMLVFPSRVLILNMRFGCLVLNFLFFKCMTNLNRKIDAQGQHNNEAAPELEFFCLRLF